MRTIVKRSAPSELTQWRTQRMDKQPGEGMDSTYQEMRRDRPVMQAIEDRLFSEQGGICAYTGHKLRRLSKSPGHGAGFHIEHMIPQTHSSDHATDYNNMVACWPEPNRMDEPPYGARRKGSWPSLTEESLFVSPIRNDCTQRFAFNNHGNISPANPDDAVAKTTIERLGLEHDVLIALRKNAIQGALRPNKRLINLKEARKLLRMIQQDSITVDQGGEATLRPFCFVIQRALEREIRKLEAISKRQ